MAKFGTFDDTEFQELFSKLDGKHKRELNKILSECMQKALMLTIRAVKDRTPEAEKNGGTLKAGWKSGGVQSGSKEITGEIRNDVPYAPYVEYGHRTRGGGGYVMPQYMLTDTLTEVQPIFEKMVEQALNEYLEDIFGG